MATPLNQEPDEMEKRMRRKLYDDQGIPDEELTIDESGKRVAVEAKEVAARLARSLVKKREKAVTARAGSGIENIWRTDRIAYEGIEGFYGTAMIDYATGEAPLRTTRGSARRSEATINIIRPKCDTAHGRFSDILLPTDNRNWGLKTTPVPDLADSLDDRDHDAVHPQSGKPQIYNNPDEVGVSFEQKDGGVLAKVADVAANEKRLAEKKMKGMERKIDDQLTEAHFNAECRKAIFQAVKAGTGILKGPFPSGKPTRKWATETDGNVTVRVLKYSSDPTPIAKSIDLWDLYPDPECREEPQMATFWWERGSLPPRKLKNLLGLKGFMDDQIKAVLKEAPTRLHVANPKEQEYKIQYDTAAIGTNYELWEYNGDLDKDDLIALGCNCDALIEGIGTATANVLMVNERVIKVQLNPMDTGDLPYHLFRWTKIEGMPWGVGVAREGLWPQQIITNALRAMMENAAHSAGANIVIGSGLEPADGHWEVTGDKIWWPTEDDADVDVSKGFAQFQIKNVQEKFEAIINLALRFIDIETQIPTIFNGEQPIVPQTLGATNIMVDSNNVTLRSRVKTWDDDITVPIITGFYDWNMQDPDCPEAVKGDMKVDPRGTSVLLERDQQGQHAKELMELKADPDMADIIDWVETAKKYLSARNLNVILPDDKIKENQKKRAEAPPPSDPQLEVAKIRAQGDMEKATAQIEADERKALFAAEQEDKKMLHEERMQAVAIDLQMMELSGKTGIELDKIKAHLSEVAKKLSVQVALSTDQIPGGQQVIEPSAEPEGRAPDGQAFEK